MYDHIGMGHGDYIFMGNQTVHHCLGLKVIGIVEGKIPYQHGKVIRKQGDEGMDPRSSYGKEYGSDDGKGGQSGTLQVSQQVGADTQRMINTYTLV